MVILNRHGKITAREIALTLGTTVRSVRRIIQELKTAGCIQISKQGRRNIYTTNHDYLLLPSLWFLPFIERRDDLAGLFVLKTGTNSLCS